MHIDVIDRFETFSQLRGNWDAVYEADPEAQFFLSWTWMSKWLGAAKIQWFILAAKPNASASTYVAFFPLRFRTKMREGGEAYNEITMAGSRTAEYTGFICMPEFQDNAILELARYVQAMNWDNLDLECIFASDTRMRVFLKTFLQENFAIMDASIMHKIDHIDNCVCPYIKLPNDWEDYLSNHIGPSTRQKVRRFLRKIDGSSEFIITHADTSTISRDLDILLRLWDLKWGVRKGEMAGRIQNNYRTMLMYCFENRSLFLPVLWKGNTPLGALAILVDTAKRSFLFYFGARDETFKGLPPGFVLHAHSILHAINNSFTVYDFMRGNEKYKYSFGAKDRRIWHIVVRAKDRQKLSARG